MRKGLLWLMYVGVITCGLVSSASAAKLLIADFEDAAITISSYKGEKSSMTISYVTDVVHEGQQAVLVQHDTKDYAGAVYNVPGDKDDWTGMTTFSLWMYGQNSGQAFHVILEDAGLEQLWYPVKDSWSGWQQVNMPLSEFQSRTDWQAGQAKVNQMIDYPLQTVHFCATHDGAANLYFDLFEVSGTGQPVAAKSAPKQEITGPSLRALAAQRGIVIGAAAAPNNLQTPIFADTLAGQFNGLTPENQMKWDSIQPTRETYNFKPADRLVEFAAEHGMKVKGHTLLWHAQVPGWLTEKAWTRQELLDILKDHITQVVGHYKGKVASWDVVNEPFDGGVLRETFWLKVIGPEYLEKAFQWAHEADPEAVLILNDYGVEEVNPKSNAMYKQVKELLANGAPVHGVGLQFHQSLNYPIDYASVYANVKRFADLGLQVHITELDVRIRGEATADDLARQSDVYRKLMEICLNFPQCTNFTLWGFTDAHSWIPQFEKGSGAALIFDEQYQPKPAYYGLQAALQAGPVKLSYPITDDAMQNRHLILPFQAAAATTVPTIDGIHSPGEWDQGVLYKFAYNQLDQADQRLPREQADLYGEWKILYQKNVIYGLVVREDDVTVTTHANDWENDTVEVFFDINGTFAQLRAIVGKDWAANSLPGARKAVWGQDGKVLEFMVELPDHDVTGLTVGWNIALADNDAGPDGTRDHQLYPIYGFNNSWEGKNLAEIKFVGDTPRTFSRRLIPPFKAVKATALPTIDGVIAVDEWKDGVAYQFAYNQLSQTDQRPPKDQADLYGDWKILYDKNVIYGVVTRVDETTVTNHADAWENDNLEVFGELAGTFAQVRSTVGQDWAAYPFPGSCKIVWSPDGAVAEFMFELPGDNLQGQIMGWNIALSDNDTGAGSPRQHQLYPIYGINNSWEGKNLAEIVFE